MRYFLSILFVSILNLGFSQEDCIDPSLIDPDAICTFIYDPVCGCDGVTYSNSCIAETTAGVTMYTMGECGTAAECLDLADIDFGDCEMEMGIALVNGECVAISGCGWEVGGTDYSPYSFTSFAACNASCTEETCLDLAEIDFGLCDFPLGIAEINGECISLSGCDWVVDGIDYAPYFHESLEDCEACGDASDCFDLAGIDFGECEMAMGIGLVDGECVAISGCGWEVGGTDYSPYSFTSYAACNASCTDETCVDLAGVDFGMCTAVLGVGLINGTCSTISGCGWEVGGIDYSPFFFENSEDCNACLTGDDCFDLEGIDFGDCDMDMGVGLMNGECVAISGCGWEVGGIDYSPYFFDNLEDCQSLCEQACEDPSIIDVNYECGIDFQPVCGCDNKTYWNACYAEYYNGITSWTEGPCSCPDATAVDPEIFCFDLYEPVCGCDEVTYTNECVAYYQYGITEWEPGECGMTVGELNQLAVNVYPNPVHSTLTIRLQNATNGTFELYDLSGKMILSGSLIGSSNTIDLSSLSSGTYLLKMNSGDASTQLPVYKID